jgi:hypothetical protein
MKPVPFYANRADNMSCMLASIRSALEYFTDKQYTWEQLEDMTGYKPNTAAWTVKVWVELARQGFAIRMIEKFDYRRYQAERRAYLEQVFSDQKLAWQEEHTHLLQIAPLLPDFLQTVQQEMRSPQLADIDAMLAEGYLVTVQLNSRVLDGREGFAGHMILVHGKDGDEYIAHDPGLPPKENSRITSELLFRAMGGRDNTTEVTGLKLQS